MEDVFKPGKTDVQAERGDGLENEIEKKHDRQVVISVLIVVFMVFLVVGWVNFQSGKSFNVPDQIMYENAVYHTQGEIIEAEDLTSTGQKIDKMEIYIVEATSGKTYSKPAHKVFLKVGEDYVVYVMKKSR